LLTCVVFVQLQRFVGRTLRSLRKVWTYPVRRPLSSTESSPASLHCPFPPLPKFSTVHPRKEGRGFLLRCRCRGINVLIGWVNSQIRQGIANHTKGTAYVVYEDAMDAKTACDKLNGFNFQNRYLVGTIYVDLRSRTALTNFFFIVVLHHQPEKMLKQQEDLAAREENLEKLKKQYGIE
jgi:hypothetical protein